MTMNFIDPRDAMTVAEIGGFCAVFLLQILFVVLCFWADSRDRIPERNMRELCDRIQDLYVSAVGHQHRADTAERELAELRDQIQCLTAAAADHQHRADTAERKLAEILDVTKRPTARNKGI